MVSHWPISVQHLSGLGVDDVNDDASVAPAPFETVAVLIALPRMEGFVQERPGQLLFAVNLQGSSGSYANVLAAKITVFDLGVIRPFSKQQEISFSDRPMNSELNRMHFKFQI